MKIDEMIEYLEERKASVDNLKPYFIGGQKIDTIYERTNIINSIALAALKADKAGYRMFTYDYSERDLVEADCELSRLLEELKR